MFFSATDDTIAALATPPGEGAVAIVRLSGKEALSIAEKIFTGPVKKYLSHTAHFGKIQDREKKTIDSVLLLIMHGPKSYTGEDSVEIHCHGGSIVSRKVLERVLEAGARAARPGEFTLRAFLNKKIDLTQAEAVQSLISAKNEKALLAASEQLEGALCNKIGFFQKELLSFLALFEAYIDFPEEEIPEKKKEEILSTLNSIQNSMHTLIQSFHMGQKLFSGIKIAIIGSPNVGKSSLLNALLGKDRAIVTPIAGTTRDLLEEEIVIGSFHAKLSDTAGIRETLEPIEQEGIRRSKKTLQDTDLILLVLDSSRELTLEDRSLFSLCPKEKTLIVWNKKDLCTNKKSLDSNYEIELSCKNLEGLEELKALIEKKILADTPQSKEEIVLTKLRHKEALQNGLNALKKVEQGLLENLSYEFLSYDLRICLEELSTIIGMNVTEELLTKIFSTFCIGK